MSTFNLTKRIDLKKGTHGDVSSRFNRDDVTRVSDHHSNQNNRDVPHVYVRDVRDVRVHRVRDVRDVPHPDVRDVRDVRDVPHRDVRDVPHRHVRDVRDIFAGRDLVHGNGSDVRDLCDGRFHKGESNSNQKDLALIPTIADFWAASVRSVGPYPVESHLAQGSQSMFFAFFLFSFWGDYTLVYFYFLF
jgi:hypothetical protein